MFLPNKNSFVLIRRSIVEPSFPVFLPNTNSFLLIRRPVVAAIPPPQSTDSEQSKIKDQGKRNFLKVAGIASAGLAASLLLPKKAEALIMGSSPTTGVVGVKNSTNTRINPATEETVASLATEATAATLATEATAALLLKTTDLDFDAGGALEVDVVNLALPPSASTETTLQTISFGGFKFALRLATVGDIDYVGEAAVATAESAALWRIKKVDSATGITITWADGNSSFDNTWTGYAGHTYS